MKTKRVMTFGSLILAITIIVSAFVAASAYQQLRSPTVVGLINDWSSSSSAFLDGGGYASAVDNSADTWNPAVEFREYGFSLPSSAIVDYVKVRADAWRGSNSATIKIAATNDASDPTSVLAIAPSLTTSEVTYWVDLTNEITWTPAKVNSIRVLAYCQSLLRLTVATCNLDWIPVQVGWHIP